MKSEGTDFLVDDAISRAGAKEIKAKAQSVVALAETRRRVWLESKGINPAIPYQLDLLFPRTINQGQRFIANDFARSAIFTAKNTNAKRVQLNNARLFHLNESIEVHFTGEELRSEDDELVWMQLMHYARRFPLGQPFRSSIRELVLDIGWSVNGMNYDKVRKCLSRLKSSTILIKNDKAFGVSASMSMISKYLCVNDGRGNSFYYEMVIDPEMIMLFANNTFTNHKWVIFCRLSAVSRRLANYIESHKQPYPLHLDKFRQLCGSSSKTTFGWRRTVKKACNDMVEKGVAKSCMLEDDLIYAYR